MILSVKQTQLLRKSGDGLENLIRIFVNKISDSAVSVYVDGVLIDKRECSYSMTLEHWIPEPQKDTCVEVSVECNSETVAETVTLHKPKHYTIHLVHHSHHDPGYTDIMSHVFRRHYEWIDSILDEMDKRDHYPESSRLRITIEQFWSLDYYLKNAPHDRVLKVIERVKRGDIEITALYGNMITEQLGHEECYRLMQHSKEFADKCGVKITSANHNDIPGISWGLCRALCDADIPYLNADLPLYYSWGGEDLVSFWDCTTVYGYEGPGVCRWKSQDGKSLLLWNPYCVSITDTAVESVEKLLDDLEKCGYPYTVFKSGCRVSNIDNSCYAPVFADGATAWNEIYEYPRLITSTNGAFFEDLVKNASELNIEIPEICGEMPGQDYPLAAMSMAQITSTALRTQHKAVVMDKLLAVTDNDPLVRDQSVLTDETWKDLMISDDHAYGSQFPAGPAMRASYWEKGVYAMRAEANTHDLVDKALASIADRIDDCGSDLRLVVFNPSGSKVSAPVETLMREWDNCGTITCPDNHDPNVLKGYILNNRRRVNPEESYWRDGKFKLVDAESGKEILYDIVDLSWDNPEYYAPESFGLGNGTARYGFFEIPGGMKRVLRFIAEDIPPFGYRCYSIIKDNDSHIAEKPQKTDFIDNGIYRITADKSGITSVIDRRTGKELLDKNSNHRLGDVLVRTGSEPAAEVMTVTNVETEQNELCGRIKINGEVDGAHEITVLVTLWKNTDKIDLSLRFLKNAKPLQTMFVAFPFEGDGFRYQGVLSEMEPGKDVVPGGQSDFLAVKDYIHIKESNIIWSSRDTAIVALGELWGGYISPAHRCVMKNEYHPPLKEDAFKGGNIYAMLAANNFGTNFMCSQVFDGVYKFSFAANVGDDDVECAKWGEIAQNPMITQFTDRSRGKEKPCLSLMDSGDLHCISLRKYENGYMARLWNHSNEVKPVSLTFRGMRVDNIVLCDALGNEYADCGNCEVPEKTVCTVKFTV